MFIISNLSNYALNIILSTVQPLSENTFINAKDINFPRDGIAVVMAGSPASAKSTIIKEQLLLEGKIIDPDYITKLYLKSFQNILRNSTEEERKELLKPFGGKNPSLNNPEHVKLLYDITVNDKEFVSNMRDIFIDKAGKGDSILHNIIIDTTSENSSLLVEWSKLLKEIGYYEVIIYVVTDYDLALNRNKKRERVVDEKYLTEAYITIHNSIPKLIQDGTLSSCDEIWVVFNKDTDLSIPLQERYKGTAFKMYRKKNGCFVIPNDIKEKIMDIVKLDRFSASD